MPPKTKLTSPPRPAVPVAAFQPPAQFLASERSPEETADLKSRINALLALGAALCTVGQPSYRIEGLLVEVGRRLGLPAHIFSLPTGMFISVEDESGPHTHLIRVRPEGAHLERLSQLTIVADKLIRWEVSSREAMAEIAAIMKHPPRWGRPAIVAAYVLSAGAFSIFFRGGSSELLTAEVVGLAVGLLAIALARTRANSRLFELVAAFAAALISETAVSFLGPIEEWIPLASGLIILLPGISLVDSVDELGNGHLASGGARMAGVGVAFLAIAFGAVLGSQLAASLEGAMRHAESQKLPDFILVPALLAIGIGSTIRFRGRYQDVVTSLVGSMVAFFGSRAGIAVEQIGPLAGPFLGALALGVVANAFARIFRRPPELISLPGIALLVPGSVGIKSLGALVGQDPHGGITEAFQMFMIAIALASGMMISNWVIRDRPPLPSDSLPT